MLTITLNDQEWRYDAENERFTTKKQAGSWEPVHRTYADWERIFPA